MALFAALLVENLSSLPSVSLDCNDGHPPHAGTARKPAAAATSGSAWRWPPSSSCCSATTFLRMQANQKAARRQDRRRRRADGKDLLDARPMSASGRAASKRHRLIAAILLTVMGMTGAAFAAVPLYRMFCQVTGFDGTVRKAEKAPDQMLDRMVTDPLRHQCPRPADDLHAPNRQSSGCESARRASPIST
jgi:hypothetical protein